MIIKRLALNNFGVYAGENVFLFSGEKPIVLIGGMNGRGKTTILEGILIALYGSNSFGYTESKYKSYSQYLRDYVNRKDGSLNTTITLEFSMDQSGTELYEVERSWDANHARTVERIQVKKNGIEDAFLTDNWSLFIENVLPSGLSNFFFFDGEKIAEIAEDNTSKQMKESIKALLGITVLDSLEVDLKKIISQVNRNSVGKSEASEVEELRAVKEEAERKLFEKDSEIEELEERLEETQKKLEKKQISYSAKGGDIVTQRNELFQKKTVLQSQIDHEREVLLNDAASELPFVLVKELLRNIRETAEIENSDKMLAASLPQIEKVSKLFLEEKKKYSHEIEEFIKYYKEKVEAKESKILFDMSDTTLFQLSNLLDERLLQTKLSVEQRQEKIAGIKSEIEKIEGYLAVEIDEKEVNKLYKEIKALEYQIIELETLIETKKNIRSSLNGDYMTASSVFNKRVENYLKKVETNDDGERLIKYAHLANKILATYRVKLQERKVQDVADKMTECYKKLANKKNMIQRIEMDYVTLELSYYNDDNELVSRNSLSAGEKQLMVISLLWALAICSKRKLPVIIDTPLSRLDSNHRTALVQTYFPNASEQTIILSTDTEIDDKYYELMKENIGDEFTLVYDEDEKSTSIQQGYLWRA